MKLSDFSYTRPNKPAIDYKWFDTKVAELDNYELFIDNPEWMWSQVKNNYTEIESDLQQFEFLGVF